MIEAFEGYGDKGSSFEFGNAQKLINMTAKYIASGMFTSKCGCGGNFQYCHCPMDSIMVDWIGYTYLDDSVRTNPAFLNSTGVMYPKVECSLKLLHQCT